MQNQLNFLEPIENQIHTDAGNQRLVDYGIQNEKSDYRAHVGYATQRVYVFPTEMGKRAILDASTVKSASVDGKTVTAEGYAVPISQIDKIIEVLIPLDIYLKYRIYRDLSTSHKGLLATKIVVSMLQRGLIPLPVRIDKPSDLTLDINGCDITVNAELKLQVKCDFLAGSRAYGGTGNLYLQTRECNKYRQY